MRNPQTPAEWQNAVDAASALFQLVDARAYGLITGGPKVNQDRAHQIISMGRQRGITPSPGNLERLLAELT